MQCTFKTNQNKRCGVSAIESSEQCFFHIAEHEKQRLEAQAKQKPKGITAEQFLNDPNSNISDLKDEKEFDKAMKGIFGSATRTYHY